MDSWLIWFIHFSNSQFDSCYFELIINLVPTINLLTKNAYVAHGACIVSTLNTYVAIKLIIKNYLSFKNAMLALTKKLKKKSTLDQKKRMSPLLFLLFLGSQTQQPRKTKINPENS